MIRLAASIAFEWNALFNKSSKSRKRPSRSSFFATILIASSAFLNAYKLRTFELKEWTIMEGTLGLRVNLSDQTIEVT